MQLETGSTPNLEHGVWRLRILLSTLLLILRMRLNKCNIDIAAKRLSITELEASPLTFVVSKHCDFQGIIYPYYYYYYYCYEYYYYYYCYLLPSCLQMELVLLHYVSTLAPNGHIFGLVLGRS